jgi:hypothetical protein
MTLLDLLKLGLIRSDAQAERLAEGLVDGWHRDLIPGDLQEVLGLTPREYQAWTTGGVSLLTIANWYRRGYPHLDASRPWFKLSGRPGREKVGYLEEKRPTAQVARTHTTPSRRKTAAGGR